MAFAAAALASAQAGARTWRVTIDGTGDAPTIQAAIDSCSAGDSVVVGPGRYTWTNQGTGNEMGFIRMMRGQERITLCSELGSEETILDAEYRSRVVYLQGMNFATVDGFTITRGDAPDWGDRCGGGLFTHIPRDRVRNCAFVANRAEFGGGVSCVINDGYFYLDNCLFTGNSVTRYGGAVGLANGTGNIYVRDCAMTGNAAGFDGGGIYQYNCGSTIERCVIADNEADRGGGGFHGSEITGARLARCTVCGNRSPSFAVGARASAGLALELSIVAFNGGAGIFIEGTPGCSAECSDVYGNTGGDALPGGFVDGGGVISLDPLFCGPPGSGEYRLASESPCLPNDDSDEIMCPPMGALGAGCSAVSVESSSWGAIKGLFR